MTSNFYFTATSWFPGNVRVKPHSKHSEGGLQDPPIFFQNEKQTLCYQKTFVTIMCRNDELRLAMSWVGCLLKDSELFVLFAENSQFLLKIYAIPILLTLKYLVALNK